MGKDLRHLFRAGLLLVGGLIAFFGVRQLFIPESFGQYGFYRGESVKEWMSRPVEYSLSTRCNDCHSTVYGNWEKSKHAVVACENCHGPATRHADNGDAVVVDRSRGLCAVCHQKVESRPDDFPQIELSSHGGQQSCISCHSPHQPVAAKAPSVPHSLEGRSQCVACHGAGGIKPFPADHQGRTSDVCLTCHQGQAPQAPAVAQVPAPAVTLPSSPSPAPSPSTTAAPTTAATPTTTSAPTVTPSGTPPVPHELEGRSECLMCHGAQGLKPVPADHAGRTKEMCLLCHKVGKK